MNDQILALINGLVSYEKVHGRLRSGGFVQLALQGAPYRRHLSYFRGDGTIAHFDANKFLSIHVMLDQSSLRQLSKALRYILESGGRIWRCLSKPIDHPIQVNQDTLYRYIANPGVYYDCMLMVEYALKGEDD